MDIKHGTTYGYGHHKCRCEACVKVWADYGRERRHTPEYRAKASERQKRYHAQRKAIDPEYRERCKEVKRQSAKRMRAIPEKWDRVKGNARRAARKRRDMLQQIKLERGCADCGYKAHPEALEFDHITTGKHLAISRIKTYSLETLLTETAKCEVVCANCHRIRTYNRRKGITD